MQKKPIIPKKPVATRMRKLVFLAIFISLLSSCHKFSYRHELTEADRLVVDSPRVSLSILDGMGNDVQGMPEHERMYYGLIRLKVEDQLFEPVKNDSSIKFLMNYYENRGDKNMLPECYYYAGKTYISLNDYPLATDFFLKALTAEKDSLSRLSARTYFQLGRVSLRQWLYPQAEVCYKKALACDKAQKDTVGIIFDLRDIASCCMHLGKREEAFDHLSSAYDLAQQIEDDELMATTGTQLARFYYEKKEYKKALDYIRKALAYDDPDDHNAVRSIAARIYGALGYADTMALIDQTLQETGSMYARQGAYHDLSKYYYDKGDFSKAMKYMSLYVDYTDSVMEITHSEQIREKTAMYDYSLREIENERLKGRLHNRNVTICLLAALSLALCAAFAFMLFFIRQKRNARRTKFSLLKMARRSREESIATYERRDIQIQETEIVIQIKQMLNNPNAKKRLEANQWRQLQEAINETYPDFDERLYSLCRMSESDYHICLLIKLKIRPSDMAEIACLSKSGLTSARRKLFKRAFGKSGGAEEWDKAVISL